MKTFTKLHAVKKITSANGVEAIIYKFRKDGTSRTFFAPEIDGNRINRTLWCRLYDAENLTYAYFKSIANKAA